MKINMDWLKQNGACQDSFPYASKIGELEGVAAVRRLMADSHPDWANWLIVKIMGYSQYVAYAIYAAEQVLHIFEIKFRDDDRPRKAIEAAKKCTTLTAAAAASVAAASSIASAASFAAAAAFSAASSAASYAAAAFHAHEGEKIRLQILEYGLGLLEAK